MKDRLRFFRRMWWFVIVGGFVMMAGLVVTIASPAGGSWAGTALLAAGTLICTAGYTTVVVYDWHQRNNRADEGES